MRKIMLQNENNKPYKFPYFPLHTINEVQTRNCLCLVKWIPPSKPVAYRNFSQRPFVIAVTVSIISRLSGNNSAFMMISRCAVESQIFKALPGFLSHQILLHGLYGSEGYTLSCKYMINRKEIDQRNYFFLHWLHKLPPSHCRDLGQNLKDWKLQDMLKNFLKN